MRLTVLNILFLKVCVREAEKTYNSLAVDPTLFFIICFFIFIKVVVYPAYKYKVQTIIMQV